MCLTRLRGTLAPLFFRDLTPMEASGHVLSDLSSLSEGRLTKHVINEFNHFENIVFGAFIYFCSLFKRRNKDVENLQAGGG